MAKPLRRPSAEMGAELYRGIKEFVPEPLRQVYRRGVRSWLQVRDAFFLAVGLRRFLRERVSLADAEAAVRRALETREQRFLETIRREVYERPASAYFKLLENAGCEFGDLASSVRSHGLEKSLEKLAAEGVYLTSEEFKGKKEVVRGSLSLHVSPDDFRHPVARPGFVAQSTGTRNRPVRKFVHLDYLATRTVDQFIFLAAHDLLSHAYATYDAILPAASGVNRLLRHIRMGIPQERWFGRRVPGQTWREDTYNHLVTYLIVLMGRLTGGGFPKPEFIDTGEVDPIIDWVLETRRRGRGCCIYAAASNAARIAQAAWRRGLSLAGTKFICSAEPFTDAKREILERAGASGTCHYAYGGSTSIGYGCANPAHTDEIHVNTHVLALISHRRRTGPEDTDTVQPLLCSTLDATSTRLLLNVESGDYAVFEERDCGCGLQKTGLTVHLHRIRSFEKFTSEGMNYTFIDLFEIVEKILPSEFGGGPGDYQLVEEEDESGQTRISVLVHPSLGPIDEQKLISRIHSAFAKDRTLCSFWRDAETFRVKRQAPRVSGRGKILPLHIDSAAEVGRRRSGNVREPAARA